MTPQQAAAKFYRVADRLEVELRKAEQANVEDLYDTAIDHSSGPYSLGELRKMDHPFAKRHATASLDPGVINEQSGEFLRSWIALRPKDVGGDLVSVVYNDDPKAENWLEPGTQFMVARPIDEKVASACEGRIQRRREKAVGNALR